MSNDLITESELLEVLWTMIRNSRSQHALADQLGISDTLINKAISSDPAIYPKLFEAMGYERVMMYRKAGK
jgi:tetrahydromethanopterin S-methyltransferase subunit E